MQCICEPQTMQLSTLPNNILSNLRWYGESHFFFATIISIVATIIAMVATIIAMVATLTWWPDPQAVCCQSSGPETPQQPIWGQQWWWWRWRYRDDDGDGDDDDDSNFNDGNVDCNCYGDDKEDWNLSLEEVHSLICTLDLKGYYGKTIPLCFSYSFYP